MTKRSGKGHLNKKRPIQPPAARSRRSVVAEYIAARRDLKNAYTGARLLGGNGSLSEEIERLRINVNQLKCELVKLSINPDQPDKTLSAIVKKGIGTNYSLSGDGKRRPGRSTGTTGVGSKLKFWR